MSLPPRIVGRPRRHRLLGTITSSDVTTGVQAVGAGASFLQSVYGQVGSTSYDSVTSGFYGAVSSVTNGAVDTLSNAAQDFYNSHSTEQAQEQTIVNGVSAAASLASNTNASCPPNSECEFETGAEVIAVYAAVLTAATGPVGAVIGAIAEAVDVVAHEILKWVGAPVGPSCVTTGPPMTYRQALQGSGIRPAGIASNSLASLALPLFAQDVANGWNCKPNAGTLRFLAYSTAIPGIVKFWNANSSGALIDYYVPRIWQPESATGYTSETTQNGQGGPVKLSELLNHPGPVTGYQSSIFMNSAAAPFAFMPLSQVPVWSGGGTSGYLIKSPADEGKDWIRIKASAGPMKPPLAQTLVAAGAGAAVAGITAATIYSYLSGQALSTLASEGLSAVKDFFTKV